MPPPGMSHPLFYYGFVGVALAWQVAFWLIARDPVRYRWFIVPGVIEKVEIPQADDRDDQRVRAGRRL